MNFAGLTLLIADPNDVLRHAVRRAAERRGLLVEEAKDAVDAIARLHSYAIDLMLVELDLPLLDGLEVSRVAQALVPEMPILMRVGRDIDSTTLRAAIDAGVADCVARTCPIDLLVERLQALIDTARPATESGEWRAMAIDELTTQSMAVVRS